MRIEINYDHLNTYLKIGDLHFKAGDKGTKEELATILCADINYNNPTGYAFIDDEKKNSIIIENGELFFPINHDKLHIESANISIVMDTLQEAINCNLIGIYTNEPK